MKKTDLRDMKPGEKRLVTLPGFGKPLNAVVTLIDLSNPATWPKEWVSDKTKKRSRKRKAATP